MTMEGADQVLVLLYSSKDWSGEDDLRKWTDYKNKSNFRILLLKSHRKRLIEYDQAGRKAKLTPKGVAEVETRILVS